MNNDVTSVVDKTVKHVQISKYVQIKFLDDEAPVPEIPAVDSNIFSIDITNDSDVFADDQLLLDTCAGESVFRTATLFYDIVPADTPMVVNGVNSRGEPMVIRERGLTNFGSVYYDLNCIANILSFANMVNNCYSMKYSSGSDFCSLQIKRGGCCYYFNRDEKYDIYICNLETMVSKPKSMLVTTVNDKMKKYTVRHVKQAELATEEIRIR